MRRRVRQEAPENHERWLVSYADFITLLFAFFVVMYSISQVNDGKYRILSDSLSAGFRGAPKTLDPIQVGSLVRTPVHQQTNVTESARVKPARVPKRPPSEVLNLPFGSNPSPIPGVARAREAAGDVQPGGTEEVIPEREQPDTLEALATRVRADLAPLIKTDQMNVRVTDDAVELELKQSTVFPQGRATIPLSGNVVLAEIARSLAPLQNPINVEGHADNTPIRTPVYPSNWELSAARAAAIVSYFALQGVNPQRMAALGFGEFRPITSNDTADGRSRNRRVVIVVQATQPEAS